MVVRRICPAGSAATPLAKPGHANPAPASLVREGGFSTDAQEGGADERTPVKAFCCGGVFSLVVLSLSILSTAAAAVEDDGIVDVQIPLESGDATTVRDRLAVAGLALAQADEFVSMLLASDGGDSRVLPLKGTKGKALCLALVWKNEALDTVRFSPTAGPDIDRAMLAFWPLMKQRIPRIAWWMSLPDRARRLRIACIGGAKPGPMLSPGKRCWPWVKTAWQRPRHGRHGGCSTCLPGISSIERRPSLNGWNRPEISAPTVPSKHLLPWVARVRLRT